MTFGSPLTHNGASDPYHGQAAASETSIWARCQGTVPTPLKCFTLARKGIWRFISRVQAALHQEGVSLQKAHLRFHVLLRLDLHSLGEVLLESNLMWSRL